MTIKLKINILEEYMKRSEILKYFDYQWDSGDYDSKDGNYTIVRIGNKWHLFGVDDCEDHNEYTDAGEYKTLNDVMDFYVSSVLPNQKNVRKG
jgi:hypothetical protein